MCFSPSKTQTCVLCFWICQGSTKFQKLKNDNKMNKPTTIPYCNNFANKNQFNNNASTLLAHKCSFFAHWFFVDMKYWPTTHSWHATLHFHLLACFCKLSNLGTKSFCLHLISLHTLLWTIINFPSHLIIYLNPCQFHDPHFLKNLIQFPLPLPMFFL
jgi:hypothetical protein